MGGLIDSSFTYRNLGRAVGITLAQLKTITPDGNVQQGELVQLNDGRIFAYHPTSVLTADDIFVVAPNEGAGRFLLAPGFPFDLALACTFATADAAVLATVPTGGSIRVYGGYWEVTADWTGGSSSAIGLSSDNALYNTQGDLHGGAGGDVAATLVAGDNIPGTIGAKCATGIQLVASDDIRFDRIVSAFTAGSGFAHVLGLVVQNAGA
jgi:hypothetical protein